jgi:DNA-binding CsgD family transcriptional regulator
MVKPRRDGDRDRAKPGRPAQVGMARPPPEPVDLLQAVGSLTLPILFIDLQDLTVRAASDAALTQLGGLESTVVSRSIIDLVSEEDRANALVALKAIGSGAIDFYSAHRRLDDGGGPERVITAWVRAVQFGGERVALAELASGDRPRPSPLAEYLGHQPLEMAVGTVNSDWVVTSVSTDITGLLGISAEEATGHRLLDVLKHGDVCRLLDADERARGEFSVALRIHFRNASDEWVRLCCVLTSLVGRSDRCFLVMPDPDPTPPADPAQPPAPDRAAQLEEHLSRIAAELKASGVLEGLSSLPDPARFPQMRSLSGRQWEILSRLIRGERVSTIAATMFVSPSTVRNHLSAIFGRFGVHSQAELLALLARTDETSS